LVTGVGELGGKVEVPLDHAQRAGGQEPLEERFREEPDVIGEELLPAVRRIHDVDVLAGEKEQPVESVERVRNAEKGAPLRREDAVNLGQEELRGEQVLEDVVTEDDVEGARGERELSLLQI